MQDGTRMTGKLYKATLAVVSVTTACVCVCVLVCVWGECRRTDGHVWPVEAQFLCDREPRAFGLQLGLV